MKKQEAKRLPAGIGMILYAAATVLIFYSCYYADFYETGLEGVRFWDILFSGQIRHFYTQIFLIGDTQYIPLYDFPMYIVFAVWNFPLWIVEKVSGIDIFHSVPCLMWMKSMLWLFLALFLKAFGLLAADVMQLSRADDDRRTSARQAQLLFLTSVFFMTGLVVLGQYDIITMTFMMLGIRAYLKRDDRRFVLWFAIAAPFKYFSILAYVPLVLLREKRIRRILLRGVEVVAPILFFWVTVPYGRPELVPGCTFSGSSSGSNVAKPVYDALFVTGIIGFGTLFVYIFLWVIFLILCYAWKEEASEKKTGEAAVYVCFVAYMIQFTFGYSHPYWLILLVPFMVLLILQNDRLQYLNLLLETLLTAAMALAQIFTYTWCFNSNIVNLSFWRMLLPGGVSEQEFSVMSILTGMVSDPRLQEYASGAGLSVFAAGMLLFTGMNCPLWKDRLPLIRRDRKEYRWLFPLRALITLCLGVVPMALFFFYTVTG